MTRKTNRGAYRRVPQNKSPRFLSNQMHQLVVSNQNQETRSAPLVNDIAPFSLRRFAVHTFIISFSGIIPIAEETGEGVVINFTLDLLPNSLEFQALFDEFRIQRVMVEFWSGSTVDSVIDYTDGTPPISQNELLQYGTLMSVSAINGPTVFFRRILKPRPNIGTTGIMARNNWLSTGTGAGVVHNGIKLWAVPVGVNGNISYRAHLEVNFRSNK